MGIARAWREDATVGVQLRTLVMVRRTMRHRWGAGRAKPHQEGLLLSERLGRALPRGAAAPHCRLAQERRKRSFGCAPLSKAVSVRCERLLELRTAPWITNWP